MHDGYAHSVPKQYPLPGQPPAHADASSPGRASRAASIDASAGEPPAPPLASARPSARPASGGSTSASGRPSDSPSSSEKPHADIDDTAQAKPNRRDVVEITPTISSYTTRLERRHWRAVDSLAKVSHITMKNALLFFAVGFFTLSFACSSKDYVRGSQEPGIDAPAMGTGLDKQDIQQMLKENLNNLRTSPVMDTWRSGGGKTVVAVFPFSNETTEHIESQLQAILSEAETWLVESNTGTVVARDRQNQIIAEIEGTRNPVFNPAHV